MSIKHYMSNLVLTTRF